MEKKELEARVADLQDKLEDALMLKREVEALEEVVRMLSWRIESMDGELEEERERVRLMTERAQRAEDQLAASYEQLRVFRSKLSYRAKAAVAGELRTVLKGHDAGAAAPRNEQERNP